MWLQRAERGTAAIITLALGLVTTACGDDGSAGDDARRRFYYAQPANADRAVLMAVDAGPNGIEAASVDVDLGDDWSALRSRCTASVRTGAWEQGEVTDSSPRWLVLGGVNGALYRVSAVAGDPLRAERMGPPGGGQPIRHCVAVTDFRDPGQSVIAYAGAEGARFLRARASDDTHGARLSGQRFFFFRSPATGAVRGYFFTRGGDLWAGYLGERADERLHRGAADYEAWGPMAGRYVLIMGSDWAAFTPKSGADPMEPLTVGDGLGKLAAAAFYPDDPAVPWNGGYALSARRASGSTVVRVDVEASPQVARLLNVPARDVRLLGSAGDRLLLHAPGVRHGGPREGELLILDPQDGELTSMGATVALEAALRPTVVAAAEHVVLAGPGRRPVAASVAGGARDKLGGPNAEVLRSLEPQGQRLGEAQAGQRLLYREAGAIYSVTASKPNERLKLGSLPDDEGTNYQRAYWQGDDAGGLVFLLRSSGVMDLAYAEPDRPGSLKMLDRDAERDSRPVGSYELGLER